MVARLVASSVLVIARPTDGRLTPDEVQGRLQRVYGALFPDGRAWARWDISRSHLVAGFDLGSNVLPTDAVTVWGIPVGGEGEASDEELLAAAQDPRLARPILGVWVLLQESAAGIRLVSSSDLTHTLVEVKGSEAVAWATRGVAALRTAGVPLRIARERVPEYVRYDYVLGDDELLEGTEVLEEASVVDSDARGARRSSYWPVIERFEPGPPSRPSTVRETLRAELARIGAVPSVHLALTAGRDSTLVASCLAELGLRAPTFTIGDLAHPDAIGARAVAETLGWEHRLMRPSPGEVSFATIVQASAWTEGLDVAWNLVGGGLSWDGPRGITMLGGSGGEIGRAYYWHDARETRPQDRWSVLSSDPGLDPGPRAAFARRMQNARSFYEGAGRSGWDGLDVLYARGRMRKWLQRTMPRAEASATLTAFTSPAVVRSLLDLPAAARASGAAFDEVVAMGRPNLHAIARASLPVAAAAPARRRHARRAITRPATIVRNRRRPRPKGDLGEVLRQLPPDPICYDALGRQWVEDRVRMSDSVPWARKQAWNILSVEALSCWLDQVG